MPDLDPLHIEQHVLSNIRCMIRESLKGSRDVKEIESRRYVLPVFLHEGNQLVIANRTEAVDGIVGQEYIAGQISVAGYKSIQTFPHHAGYF